mmetsp:Transcript_6652/g.9731  ORF Transcript_6652/g.9731 Transcript_6652/m.9731 type:complete len:99 (-) Transcript_6652:46-342(-)
MDSDYISSKIDWFIVSGREGQADSSQPMARPRSSFFVAVVEVVVTVEGQEVWYFIPNLMRSRQVSMVDFNESLRFLEQWLVAFLIRSNLIEGNMRSAS